MPPGDRSILNMKRASCDFEVSPLSGTVSRNGFSIEVMIFRPKGTNGKWHLEVVNQYGTPTKWARQFHTDRDACIVFLNLVNAGWFRAVAKETLSRTMD